MRCENEEGQRSPEQERQRIVDWYEGVSAVMNEKGERTIVSSSFRRCSFRFLSETLAVLALHELGDTGRRRERISTGGKSRGGTEEKGEEGGKERETHRLSTLWQQYSFKFPWM
jgi:hypothetical protein